MAKTGGSADKTTGFSGEIPVVPQLLEIPRTLLLPSLDALCILIVPICQSRSSLTLQNQQQFMAFWALVAFVTMLLISSHGGYRHWAENRGNAGWLALRCYLATALTLLALAVLLGHQHAISRHWTTAELVLPALLLVLTRSVAADELANAPQSAGPLVVCFNHCPVDLKKALAEQNLTSRIAGVLYLSDEPVAAPANGWPLIPDIETLLRMVRARRVKDVVFVYEPALEAMAHEFRKTLLPDLLAFPVRIWLAFSLELPGPIANGAGRCRLMPLANERLVNSCNLGKRSFDILLGVLLLAAAMPALGVIALLVLASGPGPVVFRQSRTGAHGHQFAVLKFRTMAHVPGAAFRQAAPGDNRVTRIGRLLRSTSLDELLQLVNVIRGDMSLVGPRPHAPETQVQGVDFEHAVQYYRLRHRVKPGMTGLAQIRGHRGQTARLDSLEQRIASDLEYIDTWSIWLDVLIMLRTLPTLIGQRNAY